MDKTNTLLIKPSSYMCNMNCKYCFYNDEVKYQKNKTDKFMSLETLENILSKFLASTSDTLYIVFQGGEPLLIGINFYKEMIKLIIKYNVNNIKVHFSLQTNGTLINEDFAKFFKKYHFLIGVSLDGTKDIHNKFRQYKDSRNTYDDVLKGIDLLNKYHVSFNILTVVNKDVAINIDDIYLDYMNKNLKYTQFISCLDNYNINRGEHEYSLTNDEYYNYLIKLFEYWYNDLINNKRWYHRYFDTLLIRIAGNPTYECSMNGKCAKMFAFEANGDVYPCDFYMFDEYKIGNINNDDINKLNYNLVKSRFIYDSVNKEEKCLNCKFYKLCYGGCKRDRDYYNHLGLNYYCEAYYKFFEYSYDKFIHILDLIKEHKI